MQVMEKHPLYSLSVLQLLLVFLCHRRCSTIKIPPILKVIGAKHRLKMLSLQETMTSPCQRIFWRGTYTKQSSFDRYTDA